MTERVTYFYGEDMARLIAYYRRTQAVMSMAEQNPSVARRMSEIIAHPEKPVNLMVADLIVTALGCPQVLTNGDVRVHESHSQRRQPNHNGSELRMDDIPGLMLPAPPFRKWMERQARHYRTLTSMYHDFNMTIRVGTSIWVGTTKRVHSHVVVVAADARGTTIEAIYPDAKYPQLKDCH